MGNLTLLFFHFFPLFILVHCVHALTRLSSRRTVCECVPFAEIHSVYIADLICFIKRISCQFQKTQLKIFISFPIS